MFQIGDKIVYPMYGAGVIEDIEKASSEQENDYYCISIPNSSMTIRLSAGKAETLGLRPVSDSQKISEEISGAKERPAIIYDNWNMRYKENMEKIRKGHLTDVAEVVRSLTLREREKSLSGAEKKMLNTAKQILLSEIIFAKQVEKGDAEEILKSLLFG